MLETLKELVEAPGSPWQWLQDSARWLWNFLSGAGSYESYTNLVLLILVLVCSVWIRKRPLFKKQFLNFFVSSALISTAWAVLVYLELEDALSAIAVFFFSWPAYYVILKINIDKPTSERKRRSRMKGRAT